MALVSKTISSTYSSGVTLNGTTVPLSITSTGVITKTTGSTGAIYGAAGSAWTITNSGHVTGAGSNAGIWLGGFSSTVTNAVIINNVGAVISGPSYGILSNGLTTINNHGTITSDTANEAIYLLETGTLLNDGVINNNFNFGAYLHGGGIVINSAGGTIAGNTLASGAGVRLHAVGTVTNAGTIVGGSGGAVAFDTSSTLNRLIVDPGAAFTGKIGGGNGVLELRSGASAGVLSSTFASTGITNFSSLVIDNGASWAIKGNLSSTGLGTIVISGFDGDDTIDLTGFNAVSSTFASNALVLTNAATAHATLHIQGTFVSSDFRLATDGSGGTNIVICFAAGTHIATPSGARPIEAFADGDIVSALHAGPTPIQWVGRREVDCSRHPDPRQAWPVRVSAGAFGPELPSRDLYLSPNHAVFVDDTLIPVGRLINGHSITQIEVEHVTYYHLELAQHDLVLAEGLPAETYLDVGDRANFDNADAGMRLFPGFAPPSEHVAQQWELRGCAPLVVAGPQLDRVRRRVNALAERLAVAA